jgi:hypothetical protein
MKKIIYILPVVLLVFASCEKQIIKPTSSVEMESVYEYSSADEFLDSSYENENLNKTDEKSGIIDPNGRDDIGGKKDKKSK